MMRGETVMSGSEPALFGMSTIPQILPDRIEIESRFGRITVNPQQSILFPAGLLGMPNKLQFCLTAFPSEKMDRFSVMQCMDDEKLAFITLPIEIDNPIIEKDDIAQAAHDLNLPLDDLLVILIASVHRETGVAKLSVNARAPVLVRISMRVAAQYVFPHTKYLIRQPLSL
jgi:flagellar assembly factor FliW